MRDLRAAIQSVRDSLGLLEQSKHFVDVGTPNIVRLVSDGLSGAGNYRDYYQRDVDAARNGLVRASRSLSEGNSRRAVHFLSEASEHVSSAWSWWRIYLGASEQGAESAEEGLVAAGLTAGAGILGGPALALSIALHALGFSVASLSYNDDEEQEAPLSSISESDAQQIAKTESEKAPACISPDQVSGVTADVAHDRCANSPGEDENSEYGMILRMVDERGRAAREVGNMGVLAEQEKKAIENYKPPAGPDAGLTMREHPMRTREELIAEAIRALAEWKENPGVVHDYAPFVIDSEFADVQNPDALESHNIARSRWDGKLAHYRTAASVYGEDGSGSRSNNSIMAMLFDNFLANFGRGNALLCNFLEAGGGNCEAQTKLIVSAVTAGKVKLPDNQILAVQVFARHVQAVIYNRETHSVWNLMTGKYETTVNASLYDPHIFHLAYLKKLRMERLSPVSEKDLLIYAPVIGNGMAMKLEFYDTNTNMQFPDSGVILSSDPQPEYARLSSPYGSAGGILSGVALDDMGADRESAEEFLEWVNGLDYVYREGHILFRYKKEADTYNSILSREDKAQYLIHLTRKAAVEILSSPEMKTCLALFSRPSIARRMSPEAIEESVRASWRLEGLLDGTFTVLCKPKKIGGEPEKPWDRKEFESIMAAESPLIRLYFREKYRSLDLIATRPGWFVAYLDTLSHERRVVVLEEFLELGYFMPKYRLQNELRENFAKAVADKRLIAVKKSPRAGFESTRRPQNAVVLPEAKSISAIEIELVDDGRDISSATNDSKLAEADRVARKGKKTGNRKSVKTSRARHETSKDTMIDLVLMLALGNSEVAGRWNPSLSRRFMQLNRDGRYDDGMEGIVSILAFAYPQRSRTVKFEMYRELVNLPPDLALIMEDIRRRRDARMAGM